MAEEKEKNEGPKDITPNPLEEVTKQNEKEQKSPEEQQIERKEGDETPEKIVEIPKSFFDSSQSLKTLQIILIVFGLYGIFLSINPQEFLPLPGFLGALMFLFASILENRIVKLQEKAPNIKILIRYIITGIIAGILILFFIEFFRKFDQTVNKNLLAGLFLVIIFAGIVDFYIYIKNNKKALIADLYMFLAIMLGLFSLFSFHYMYVVPSFFTEILSLIFLITSLAKDPLLKEENKDRYSIRVSISFFTLLMFLSIFIYALTLFTSPRINVLKFSPIPVKYKYKPQHLSWAGNDWAFAFNVFDKKKKESKIVIINALTLGITELPPAGDKKIKLPEFIDHPLWNKKGNFLIFSAGDKKNGGRNIWGIKMQPSLLEIINKNLDKKTLQKLLTDKTQPIGKPKVLLADLTKIIDKECKPILHKTIWSPDGDKFVFSAKDKGNIFNIWKSDVKREEIVKLTKEFSKIFPLWSPSGDKILYASKKDSYTYLEVSKFGKENQTAHEFKLKKDKKLFPLWDYKEEKVIFIKNNKLVIMNANATNQKPLSRKTLPDVPYWLTEKKEKIKLKYTESGIIWRIYTMNTKGKKHKLIFKERCLSITQPKWDYDGKTIAVGVNYENNTSSIWRLGKNGEFKTRIYTTKNINKISQIEWAPSSDRLAFIVKKPFVEELWVVNNDGTLPLKLYTSKGKIDNITWDNQGKRIAFNETYSKWYFNPKITVIKVVHAISGERWNVLPYEFYGEYPAWSEEGDMIAYVGWKKMWLPSLSYRVWIARIQ